MSDKDIKYNASGYYDPTAYEAIKNMQRDEATEERIKKFMSTVNYIANLAGFHIENRIELKDKKTGRIWR